MDGSGKVWHFSDMNTPIPAWQLYGERRAFPDVMHIERIVDRAAGLEWRIAPHRHLALHQVMLLQAGDLRLTIDGQDTRPTPPVVVNMPRGTVHGFRFSVGTEGYVLTLPAADFPEIFAPGAPAAAPAARPLVLPAPPGIAADFARIAALYRRKSPLRLLALRAACTGLLCAVAEAARDSDSGSLPAGRDAARVARFLDLVRGGSLARQGVAGHAAALGLSPRHLARLCRDQTGQSPKALIEADRLREACRLLVYTRMPVQEVAWQLGFDDPAYFARRFRALTGQTATAYRAAFDGHEPGPPLAESPRRD